MAAGVLERHASVAGSPAGTARAPPAGLGPTLPPETPVRAGPCARPRERFLGGRIHGNHIVPVHPHPRDSVGYCFLRNSF